MKVVLMLSPPWLMCGERSNEECLLEYDLKSRFVF